MDLRRAIEVSLFFFGWLALTFQLVKGHHGHPGFISIDCGIEDGTEYTDETTEIPYTSGLQFVDSGRNDNISPDYTSDTLPRQLSSVRSFPQGINNCYTVKPTQAAKGNKYLIRAIFMYGNYDSKNQLPEFDLYLEVHFWDTVKFKSASDIVTKEIIHIPKTDYIHICLVNQNTGTPFVSAIEIRDLNNSIYQTHESGSLMLIWRRDVGSTDNKTIRHEDDEYDRIWEPFSLPDWEPFSASYTSDTLSNDIYQPPSAVMSTAVRPTNGATTLDFHYDPADPHQQFYLYLYFAEVEPIPKNQLRKFEVSLNSVPWKGPIVPKSMIPTIVSNPYSISENGRLSFSIYKTNDSALPPILNALELYMVKQFIQLPTNQIDVDAVRDIKSIYKVERNWQGDPCAPKNYSWDGLLCKYANDDHDSPVIIYLNLSSSSLTGNIAQSLSNLTSLVSLDLSNNKLTGSVPDFLGELVSLKTLNLSGNMLTGSVPSVLIERSNNGDDLILRVDGNQNLCVSNSCRKKKNVLEPVVASIAVCLVLAAAFALLLWLKRRKNHGLEIWGKSNKEDEILEHKNRQFTYSEVVSITRNFRTVLGKGGFGSVYGGNLDDGTQVAVKMLSSSSTQGPKQFLAEAQMLTKIHHRNLAILIGYCNEGQQMGIIYEYMANGNLQEHLSEKSESVLSWEQRLQIAVDAAQALEYLHNGCKPPIIHRDIKTSNILLNEKMQAKVADFGLSRFMPPENASSSFSSVVGTLGYLDPAYYESNMLNEKSDVYSFGIVLLELITGQPPVKKNRGNIGITEWIKPMLERGEIMNIADPRLRGYFDTNSVWKALETAMACVLPISVKRPNMSQVLVELKGCLETEIAHGRTSILEEEEEITLSNLGAAAFESSMGPSAR